MSHSTRVGFLAAATALTLTGVSVAAPAPEAATSDGQATRIAALEAKVAAMEASQNQNWMTEERAAEIRGVVQDVLADADTRASLLQSGMTSGYDNGFILSSTDGNWLLKTNFLMQQRFIYNNVDSNGAQDDNTYGFENTRSKFILHGHVVNPDWFYWIDTNIGTGGGTTSVLYAGANPNNQIPDSTRSGVGNAYLGYNYGNGFKVTMGSFKDPFLREDMVNAEYQLAVERTNLNYNFTTGYVDGMMVTYEGDQFKAYGNFSDGANSGQLTWNTVDTDYAFTGRGEFLASGNWQQFSDFTSPQGSETGILVGAAAHWEKGEYGTAVPETEVFELTGDVSVELGGANIYGAVVWSDLDPSGPAPSTNPWGFMFQGGFYLNESWEIYGRYEWADYDIPGVDNKLNALTFGVNKYFSGHNAKWTTDFGWGIDAMQGNASTITGWVNDASLNDDNQIVIRTQWQILF